MGQFTADKLVIRAGDSPGPGLITQILPEQAGWETLWFQAWRLPAGERQAFESGARELALVVLGGLLNIVSSRGTWREVGGRARVFDGLPHALYLPRDTSFTVTAAADSEFALASSPADGDFPPCLIRPCDVAVETRGGDHATRQINGIVPPGFPCQRLVVVEVYTPGGNWSSYPPHKHDIHKTGEDGRLLEADLDEIYYYRIDPPGGFALQRIYSDVESPLARAGRPIDAAVVARDNDVVLVPEGYHPVSSPVGYTTYYLNVLAGSAQSLAATDDPQYAWIKDSYRGLDPRIPIYDVREGKQL